MIITSMIKITSTLNKVQDHGIVRYLFLDMLQYIMDYPIQRSSSSHAIKLKAAHYASIQDKAL